MGLRAAEETEASKTAVRGNPADLAEAGWGVVFGHDADPAIHEALSELLLHRQIRATWQKEGRYRELVYRPGETKHQFLARYGVGPGLADPDQMPYYLLLIGSPAEIPYSFQRQLGVQRAVGRICFDTPLAYARYARSVVTAEGRDFDQARRAVLFAPEHAGDRFTSWSARRLMAALAERASAVRGEWAIEAVLGPEATKDRLARLVNGPESPALLVAAGHGLGFPPDDQRQLAHQGALLCGDWSGPGSGPVRPELYFSGEDVDPGASLLGAVNIYLASFSAGTPRFEEYAKKAFRDHGEILADQPFAATLPQRLLGQPTGGVLAFVGLVDRLWGYAPDEGLAAYKNVLQRLMAGLPVGHALEPGRLAYAEASVDLADALEEIQWGARPDDQRLFQSWATAQDWGNMVVLGDPAARIAVKQPPAATVERPTIRPVVLQPEPTPEPERPVAVHPFARLADAGWGAIFPASKAKEFDPGQEAIQEALQPLLDRRRNQAGERFRIFAGADGPRPGETALQFLTRHGIGAGAVTPEKVPYYLLLVGDPEGIPYDFQYQLDVRYAVGRIHFETVEEYAHYARSVVAAESGGASLPRRVTFFGVQNPDDRATEYGLNYHVKPVARRLAEAQPDWAVEMVLQEEATKARLGQLLGGGDLPALLFTASHGLAFSIGSPRQGAEQGALVCQDWPGPQEWRKPIPPDFYFSGDDVPAEANLLGLLLFLSGPYTAGTPRLDDFAPSLSRSQAIAPQAFVARLPQRLLGHPGGGALAVIGHVEQNWSGQLVGPFPGAEAFLVLRRLLEGYPVGLATEPYDLRYGQLATEWLAYLLQEQAGEQVDPHELAAAQMATIDARNYVIVGDPAARLAAGDGPSAAPRPQWSGLPFAFQAHDPAPFANLAAVGWGAVFAANMDDESGPKQEAIEEALQPLLDRRRAQAGERFRIFAGADGCRRRETALAFLSRQGVGYGWFTPEKVPYYLLLVGDPEAIPYDFQYQLDVRYAVGRIHFETVEEYAQYARSVVAAETEGTTLPRRATFFGVQNPGDRATKLSTNYLIKPLAERLAVGWPEWVVETVLREGATKARLGQLLGGDGTPALLFTASHGMGFPNEDPRQVAQQGALVCQDWPGHEQWRDSIPPDFYFAGDDVPTDANLRGLVAIFFANYGAGTPRLDNFAAYSLKEPEPIAPQAFVARLPQRLLGHPRGGALAVIGHVERAWGYSFLEPRLNVPRVEAFVQTLQRLLEGYPVGLAMEYLNARYSRAATEWVAYAMRELAGEQIDDWEFIAAQTAAIDARNYVVIGDPAARLAVVAGPAEQSE